MKKIILALFLIVISTNGLAANNWSQMICNGYDTAGFSVTLIANMDSNVVFINGDPLRIVGKTVNGRGVVTEDFVSTQGTVVYDSIVPAGVMTVDLYQFNSVTDDLLAMAHLYCDFYANAAALANTKSQKIFKGLRLANKMTLVKANTDGYHRVK